MTNPLLKKKKKTFLAVRQKVVWWVLIKLQFRLQVRTDGSCCHNWTISFKESAERQLVHSRKILLIHQIITSFWPDDKTGSYVNAMWRRLSSEQLDERSHCPDAWSAALQLICLDRNKGPSICLIWKLCSQIGCLIMTGQTSCKKLGVWVSSGIALYLETNVLD